MHRNSEHIILTEYTYFIACVVCMTQHKRNICVCRCVCCIYSKVTMCAPHFQKPGDWELELETL